MLSNLRSLPIEGHVTDSAGNVLRNSQIVIKQQTPFGSTIIDSVSSDDSGYFISSPIPNGSYDIYESGVKISRIIHDIGNEGIQCFQAERENYNPSIIGNFSDLAADYELNSYKSFIQIESPNLNISQLGNIFPLYDRNISQDPESSTGLKNEIYEIALFFELTNTSRITISRFDVEYFLPLTTVSNTYKRIKWAGIPGIRFYNDSKLVLPLDYYSITANNPKIITPVTNGFDSGIITSGIDFNLGKGYIADTVSGGTLTTLTQNLFVGDILKLRYKSGTSDYAIWYGIVTSIDYSDKKIIYLEKWRSSRFESTANASELPDKYIHKIFAFDGMVSNLMNISQEVNLLFSVVENFSAQNQESELYNYINQSHS